MPPNKEPSEGDIVFNRANVALAKNQRLIASWLPPRTAQELSSSKTEDELEREEQEMFAPVPELLGVGATAPADFKDGLPLRRDLSALDRLKVQLLGKKTAGKTATKGSNLVPHFTAQKDATKPTPPVKKPVQDDTDEEEDGRTSAVVAAGSRPSRKERTKIISKATIDESPQVGSNADEEPDLGESEFDQVEDNAIGAHIPRKESKRKSSSFMDEILAETARKKKKKRRKQEIKHA